MACVIKPMPSQWDSRIRPLPIPASEKQIRAAYAQGVDDGEQAAYPQGWRSGLCYGAVYGMLAGALLLWGALHLGLLVGAE